MPDVDIKDAVSKVQPESTIRSGEFSALRPAIIPVAVTLLCLLPFIGRAFSLDDPLFLWMAKHMLAHPGDPYGFSINWYGASDTMSSVMKNPPLSSYFIACIARLAGFRETALHLAFLLPAIAMALGTYLLAKRFCGRPVEAALISVLTPVFLICSSTVMCDTMMLAFWVWSIFLWTKGMSENRHWMMALSGLLIAAAALAKYYGIALIPLLLAYSFISSRRPGWWLLHFLIPAAILAAYQYWTKALYGQGLLLDAFRYANERRMYGDAILPRLLLGLSFTGGSIAGLIFYGPLLWSRRALLGYACFAGAVIALLGITGAVGYYPLRYQGHTYWGLIIHFGLFAAAGLSLLVMAFRDLKATRNADSVLLILWISGTFLFASLGNWTVSARTLLPMAPAVGILIMRQSEHRGISARHAVWPLVLCAFIALATANADQQFADSARTAAKLIHSRFKTKGATHFEGHWGFQYYMEPLGAKPMAYGETRLREGDVLIIPRNNSNARPLPPGVKHTVVKLQATHWLTTMDGVLGVGFHSAIWGPVPFAFSCTTPERYRVAVVNRNNIATLQEDISQFP